MNELAYPDPAAVKSIAVIGTGAVGASWIALLLGHGFEVLAFDPRPGAESAARHFVTAAWPALQALGKASHGAPPFDRLRFTAGAGEAARAADVIQENTPEKPSLKAAVIAELDAAAAPHKVILSSTGGIAPSELQSACRHPQRFIVLHPFNPAHLIPLVEIVPGRDTAPEVVEWTMAFATLIGKRPIRLRRELPGHMTNRLQFALMREVVHCLQEGIASAADIDAALRDGLAPRWSLMGGLMTMHLAGGTGGMASILEHAGAAIESWWRPAADIRLDAPTRALLVAAAEAVAHGHTTQEWADWRDEQLVELLELRRIADRSSPGSRPPGSGRPGTG